MLMHLLSTLSTTVMTSLVVVSVMIRIFVAEWIHFTHVGIILPTIKLKV